MNTKFQDEEEYQEHMASRADEKYQESWRNFIEDERIWIKALKKHNNVFASLLEIWCSLTEAMLDMTHEKYKQVKITNRGSKEKN